jgi:PTS system nitrogen regulatory IIA component
MSSRDYDVDSLSKYLHLTPAQITKLAERGQLPGRRIGGGWRFPEAEIHHWLETRLGEGGDEKLTHVKKVLDQSQGEQLEITIAGLLSPDAMAIPLAARTRSSVITAMTELAAQTGWLWDVARMEDAVRARENLHSTALENGVALLHPRRPLPDILAQSFLALGRTNSGIPFGDERGRLTDIFFLVCSLDDASHLRILARLSRLLMEPDFLTTIRAATSATELWEQIANIEVRVFPL